MNSPFFDNGHLMHQVSLFDRMRHSYIYFQDEENKKLQFFSAFRWFLGFSGQLFTTSPAVCHETSSLFF